VQDEVVDDAQANALGERAAELLRESGGHLYLAKAAVEPLPGAALSGSSAA
jgi:hypothetical protein